MKKIIFIVLTLTLFKAYSQVEIKLENLKKEYKLGDLIELDINVESNDSINNLYFELEYENDVLDWVELKQTNLTTRFCEVLQAHGKSKNDNQGKIVISTNWDEDQNIYTSSHVMQLVFRVTQSVENSYIKFGKYGVKKLNGDILSVEFEDDYEFKIINSSNENFIMFKDPQDGHVVDNFLGKFNLIFSKNSNYFIQLKNDSNGAETELISAPEGYYEDLELFLRDGKNSITAFLYDKDKSILALDTASIHYKDINNAIRIISPEESSVVNQNKILVKVASSMDEVLINRVKANSLGYMDLDQEVYSRDIWLKPGFNKIHVEAISSRNEKYSKEISIYFEKSDNVFRILTPLNSEIIKHHNNFELTFTGEISQKFNDDGSENLVTYDVLYFPNEPTLKSDKIISGGLAKIVDNKSTDSNAETAYLFTNVNPIDLSRCNSGTIEIKAYRNKVGTNFDELTSSYFIIDDSKLQIILKQPRVYVDEELSTGLKITNFHKIATEAEPDLDSVFNKVDIDATGEVKLTNTLETVGGNTPWSVKRQGFIELNDGTLLYYANKNGIARFKSRSLSSDIWKEFYPDTNEIYIYDIKETEKGLLLGVSNYDINGNSGLYLLQDGKLKNIVIGKPITHVQFIRIIDDVVFLYGNDYSHIYSFNLNTLEPNGNKLETNVVQSFSLSNSLSIKDFKISKNLNTVAILTTNGDLTFYSLNNGQYLKNEFSESDEDYFKNIEEIEIGNYKQGAYNTWLIRDSNSIKTIMERKEDGKLSNHSYNDDLSIANLKSYTFYNDEFQLLFSNDSSSCIKSGKFFFNKFIETKTRNFNSGLIHSESDFIMTKYNGAFWGEGVEYPIYNFTSEIEEVGELRFSYKNPDIEGIKGFSFNVPNKWTRNDSLTFDFNLDSNINSSGYTNIEDILNINDWVEKYKNNQGWKAFLSYSEVSNSKRINIEFEELQKEKILDFIFRFKSSGVASPVVSDIKIIKKVPIQIPTSKSSSIDLPIKGRVTDPTVRSLLINNETVFLDSIGSFKKNLVIDTSIDNAQINLTCSNSVGETVFETFQVQLFESINGLYNTKFYLNKDNELTFDSDNESAIEQDSVLISSNYFGLKGVIFGYELLSITGNTLINKGLFEKIIDTDFNEVLFNGNSENLESGKIILEPIELIPGSQKIRIYVENPGGLRKYFYLDEDNESLPVIVYNMPQEDEKIKITNAKTEDISVAICDIYEDCNVLQSYNISVPETESVPYEFKKRIKLYGTIDSLQQLSHVKLKSSSEDVTFINDAREIEIEVNEINNFEFDVNVLMKEDSSLKEEHYIVMQPLAPYLINLKSVIKLKLTKDFKGAHIIPDFSNMDDNPNRPNSKWSEDEKNAASRLLEVKFTRKLPIGARLKLVVNFNKTIDGLLSLEAGSENKYYLLDDEGNRLHLDGVKFGINRIRWDLYYGVENDIISSSLMSNPDMKDYIFTLTGSSTFVDTDITFDYNAGTYYKEDNIPKIEYQKDSSTKLKIILNDIEYDVVEALTGVNSGTFDLRASELLEGKNEIKVLSITGEKVITKKYTLLYDSKAPLIGEKVVTIDLQNNIKTISTIVNEANIRTVLLYEKYAEPGKTPGESSSMENLINVEPVLTPLSSKYQKVTWRFYNDDIPLLEPPLNPHKTLKQLKVVVTDYADRSSNDEYFKGPVILSDDDPLGQVFALKPNGLNNDQFYNDSPEAHYRKTYTDDKQKWVFYDNDITITADEKIDKERKPELNNQDFIIERPGNINIKDLERKSNSPTVIRAGKNHRVSLSKGFSISEGNPLIVEVGASVREAPRPGKILSKTLKEISIYSTVTFEETPAFLDEAPNKLRKIITLGSLVSDEFSIGYLRNENKEDIDIYLEVGSTRVNLVENVETKKYNLMIAINNNSGFKNLDLFLWDESSSGNKYSQELASINLPSDFLNKDTPIYLGDYNGIDNGHFSISGLVYISKALSSTGELGNYTDNINELMDHYEKPASTTSYEFDFTKAGQVFEEAGDESHQLRTPYAEHSSLEDVEYKVDGSALIGMSHRRNFLEINNKKEFIVFNDCTVPITTNDLNYRLEDGFLKLYTKNEDARYTFGNRPTNHSLKNDRFYSIAGSATADADRDPGDNINAELVLLFNNKETRYDLKEGNFHFIYENKNNEVPKSVVLYVETSENIYLGEDLQFVEGNSRLGNEVLVNKRSYAKTNYSYGTSGTVEFYYKPFNVNNFGQVDYDAFILDGDLVDIYTKNNVGKICYTAKVGDKELVTNIPVLDGWHHLMVTYSGVYNQVRFYIDGEIVAYSDDYNHFYSKQVGDNIVIGGNLDKQKFAQGYIDKLKFNSFCLPPKQPEYGKPLILEYDTLGDVKLTVSDKDGGNIQDCLTRVYSILSKNRNSAPLSAIFNVKGNMEYDLDKDVFDKDGNKKEVIPGLYYARLSGLYNGKRISSLIQFVRDDKPSFKLIKSPKLIINNVKKELSFDFVFDNSYLPEENNGRYPAMALKIKGIKSGRLETIYLSQDFSQQNPNLWICKKSAEDKWVPIIPDQNVFSLVFPDQEWAEEVAFDYESFYFRELFSESEADGKEYKFDIKNQIIPVASLDGIEIKAESFTDVNDEVIKYEYMIDVSLAGAIKGTNFEKVNDFSIRYSVKDHDNNDIRPFNFDGYLELYYDDILEGLGTGNYEIQLDLIYKGSSFQSKTVEIEWKKVDPGTLKIAAKHLLKINKLELLSTENIDGINRGDFYFSYQFDKPMDEDIVPYYILSIKDLENNHINEFPRVKLDSGKFVVLDDLELSSGRTEIAVKLFEVITDKNDGSQTIGIIDTASTVVSLTSDAPEIVLTNSVPSYVSYNNMTFTWKGLVNNKVNENIKYTYSFDHQEWNTPSPDWKSLELYGLDEGFHQLKVKAEYNEQESSEAMARFIVDTKYPIIRKDNIEVEKIYDDDGIATHVRFKGVVKNSKGAVEDVTLDHFIISDYKVGVSGNGEFVSPKLPLVYEGKNRYYFTAIDMVGNRTEVEIIVENSFFDIVSPSLTNDKFNIKYSPLTFVGKLKDKINQKVDIFIEDSLYANVWHKAKINSDRVFFIDDIAINPGTRYRKAKTYLKLKFVFESGAEFYKDIELEAGSLFRPLQVQLSKQTTQGQGEPIEININAKCNIENIASWSIDFDGDGIYDDINVLDNTDVLTQNWKHSYSTIGEVVPRVRVITREGEYFTASTSLIIHEEIKSASTTAVLKPIDMSIVHLEDKSEKVFVLNGDNSKYIIDTYLIGRNLNYFSNKQFSINLEGLIIGTPKIIKCLDEDSFILITDSGSESILYHFMLNDFGNYVVKNKESYDSHVTSVAVSDNYVFITNNLNSTVNRISRADDILDFENQVKLELKLPEGDISLPSSTPLTFLNGILYAADKNNQRIVEYNENLNPLNYWGEYGHSDKEFIRPEILSGYGNRLFIYDEFKESIQVFDSLNTIVSSIDSYGDYLEDGFLNELVAIDSLGREEGGRLYYYLVALSKSSESLSLLRLPKWEEMRAKTRNNKIVFLKDREVYTAKPNGSDLRKVLSTDSLPRIDGVIDYPTLSPDGRRLTFVSRKAIYTGNLETATEETFGYDNLYILEIGNERPVKIPLNAIEGYEIERPIFNSNGDSITFSARTNGGFWQIYEYNWNDGTVSKLFESIENLRFPFYSPDDRYIVYSTDYDGDQDLEIYDKENPDIRIEVTNNDFRDSFPVWSRVYPFEIANEDYNIESKIAFVSDRGFNKGIHYIYISKTSENDLRIVTETGDDIGNKPDDAAIKVTTELKEGDYPAFTGDGKHLVYEEFDGAATYISKWAYEDVTSEKMNLPEGSQKPSGMRNTITGFKAELVNGNEVKLIWTPYTDHKTFYKLQYQKASEGISFTQKKVYSQNGTTVTGLEMNTDYIMRVIIEENEEKVAETRWLKVEVPEVVARASYEIDESNPYLVKLHAWKPEEDTKWKFSWIIDNQEVSTAGSFQDIHYEFGTSGEKTIQLKTTNKEGTYTSISEPFTINIVSDIKPIITPLLITGNIRYLELDAENSIGSKINMSTAQWTITGPGVSTPLTYTGSKATVDVSQFIHKVNVNLKLSRHMVQGQQATDTLEVNKVVDLDYIEVKPIITYESSIDNERLITFSGSSSMGNIDWRTATWSLYSDGNLIHRADGVSTFSYLFEEKSRKVPYTVALTVGDVGTGLTKTNSITVDVDPAEMVPVIDYEILTLKDNDEDIGVKVVLSATGSKGSNIDFNSTEWNIPIAAQHGEQPKQKGPTAIFNLRNPGDMNQIEVSLTLMRRGGTDVVTKTTLLNIDATGVSKTEIFVNKEIQETTEGYVVLLDVLNSKGPDIDWKNTEWLLNGQYSFKGPIARVDKSYMGEEQSFTYSVTLYRFGSDPIIQSGSVPLDPYEVLPVINWNLEGVEGNTFSLTVKNTDGLNIDWPRTLWSIYDGNENVVQKRGATILHTFVPKSEAMGYPVMVEMYLKNDNTPFYGYKSIDVKGDEIVPVIQWDEAIGNIGDDADKQVISFTALSSTGSGIDWSKTKWNFGDGSAPAYGASVQHKYPIDGNERTYKIALTLTRTNRNGYNESKTVYKNIDIEAQEIKPVITARLDRNSNTLILSAEKSEGRGLLLDRTIWAFAGKGDTENFSRSKSSVETTNNSLSNTQNSTNSTSSNNINTNSTNTTSTTSQNSSNSISKNTTNSTSQNRTDTTSQNNTNTDSSNTTNTNSSNNSWNKNRSKTNGTSWNASASLKFPIGANVEATISGGGSGHNSETNSSGESGSSGSSDTTSNGSSTSNSNGSSNSNSTGSSNSNSNGSSNSNSNSSSNSNSNGSSNSNSNGSSNSNSNGSSNSNSNGTSDTQNNNLSFSTQNKHVGAVCRRYIDDFNFDDYEGGVNDSQYVWVTLFVYRQNPDGSMSGVSMVEKIGVEEVKNAGNKGKEYK